MAREKLISILFLPENRTGKDKNLSYFLSVDFFNFRRLN